jgi:hypothetical protein
MNCAGRALLRATMQSVVAIVKCMAARQRYLPLSQNNPEETAWPD